MILRQIREQIENLLHIHLRVSFAHLIQSSNNPVFEKVRISPKSGDGGIDFKALQIEEEGAKRIIGEAKKWKRLPSIPV